MFESAGGDPWTWMGNLFGGSSGASMQDIGFGPGNIAPGWAGTSLPSGASLPASTQDIGFGPGNVAPGWGGYTGKTGGMDLSKLSGALTGAGNAAKDMNQGGAGMAAPMAQSGVGGGKGQGLGELVALLQKRTNQYFPATSGAGPAAQPVAIQRIAGLLG